MISLLTVALSLNAAADPCGMVPPVWIPVADNDTPVIQRQGDQITYVFFRDGIETMVLRPGFSGSVDEFGMLIPFPSPPVVRKTADDTFAHLAAAVDPPTMTVEVYEPYYDDYAEMPMSEGGGGGGGGGRVKRSAERPLRFDEVRVVSQEAVGMYEVAVLEAGSPKALQTWMEDHKYRYPDGMDKVVEDYVEDRWAFVAIKAQVGQMPGVAPQPGMTGVDAKLPKGATFDGHVQGMGFRFKTDEPVVPMRLAAFNDAGPENLVYLLADDPLKIDGMKDNLVVRQIDGHKLLDNLHDLIPVNVINGSLSNEELDQLDPQRSPVAYSGLAEELFAADLLAVQTGELALPFEEYEKDLLRVSEKLGLRGPEVDALHHVAIEDKKGDALDDVVSDLSGMTLTVLHGDFDARYLASQNVRFAKYQMPNSKNHARNWTRAPQGPYVYWEQGGGWWEHIVPGGGEWFEGWR